MEETQPQLSEAPLRELIEEFRKGAILLHHGAFLESEEVQRAGWSQYIVVVRALDAKGPGGRDALIPLLRDPDPGVRAVACAFLVKRNPELALPVLDDLIDNCGTEASGSASNTKGLYEIEMKRNKSRSNENQSPPPASKED